MPEIKKLTHSGTKNLDTLPKDGVAYIWDICVLKDKINELVAEVTRLSKLAEPATEKPKRKSRVMGW